MKKEMTEQEAYLQLAALCAQAEDETLGTR